MYLVDKAYHDVIHGGIQYKEGTVTDSSTDNLTLQTDTLWSSSLCAALNYKASHSRPAPSWTTELCTGDSHTAPLSPL